MGMGMSEQARLEAVEQAVQELAASLSTLRTRVEAHLDGVDNSAEFERADAADRPGGRRSKPALQGGEAA